MVASTQKLNTKQIKALAKEKLGASAGGLRWSKLLGEISEEYPNTPFNTIRGATQTLFKNDTDIIKISKGVYSLKQLSVDSKEDGSYNDMDKETLDSKGKSVRESEFYEPFAEWLRDELDEVTEAIAIGGNIFKGKWNTPDVIGVLRPLRGDLVKFEPQIVSAEIKIDPLQPVIAFGQAISYRLFSHKCYLVLPDSISQEDEERITGLASVFGLGFVKFSLDPTNPKFILINRAIIAQPDMIYVNQMAKRLEAHDRKSFDRLF